MLLDGLNRCKHFTTLFSQTSYHIPRIVVGEKDIASGSVLQEVSNLSKALLFIKGLQC
jgi:hypothetical protein